MIHAHACPIRRRPIAAIATIAIAGSAFFSAATCFAAGTPPPRSPQPPTASQPDASLLPAASKTTPEEARARAEALYAAGYRQVEEAKAQIAVGKTKEAKKKYEKARKQFEEAVQIEPKYYEAWNMVGFCARKSGDLKRAFAAYERSLAINPDYEEAHEYLGEAYLLSGDLPKAKEQLAWLKARKSDEAEELEEAINESSSSRRPGSASATSDPSH